MIKIIFASIVLMGSLTAATALAEDADCLTANAERPDREAYCFKQAQDAALQETKEKLNQDFQNSLKKNKPQPTAPTAPTEPGAAAPGGEIKAPGETSANPTNAPKAAETIIAPAPENNSNEPKAAEVIITTPTERSQTQQPVTREQPVTHSTNVTTPTEQIVKPGSDSAIPDTKRVLPKPKTHPPIQYY